MKKFIAAALILISALSASAQMMTSRTLMKRDNPTTWYVRMGLSINSLNGLVEEDKNLDTTTGSKAGFELDFGFNKPMGRSGAYWGMELGVGNRGGSIDSKRYVDKYSLNAWSIKYSPITFGYKYSVTDRIKIDGHLGGYALLDMSRKCKSDDNDSYDPFDSSFDLGLQVGVGVWYSKFNLDFTYQHGFLNFALTDYSDLKTSAFLIRLGYAF